MNVKGRTRISDFSDGIPKMMPRLVIVQHANKDTESPEQIIPRLQIPIEKIWDHVSVEEYEELKRFAVDGKLTIRGVTAGKKNRTLWDRVEPGDLALVAWNNHIHAIGEVILRTRSTRLAKSLFEDRKYELIYFLRNVEAITLSFSVLNEALGFEDSNSFQGFRLLDEQKSAVILTLLSKTQPQLTALSHNLLFDMPNDLDRLGEANFRTEQSILRRAYFSDRADGECALCGRTFPIGLLVAAHIKKRSKCSDAEKRDVYGNVMPACRFGCDELFERGYIGVVNSYVRTLGSQVMTPAMREYVNMLEGRKVEYWDRKSTYFAEHARDAKRQNKLSALGDSQ